VKSPRTQRSNKKTTNMFSKNLLGGKLKNPKEPKEEDEHLFSKGKERMDRGDCCRHLSFGKGFCLTLEVSFDVAQVVIQCAQSSIHLSQFCSLRC
jgi:hypothetical protein